MKRNIIIMTLFTIASLIGQESEFRLQADSIDYSQGLKAVGGTYENAESFCLEKGTPVLMSDGTSKAIEKITAGDKILSVNTTELTIEEDIVEKADSSMHNNFVKITFDDLTANINTDDQPYFVKGKGWCSANPESTLKKYKVRAYNLRPGDDCYKILNGKLINVRITTIQRIPGRMTGYNIVRLGRNNSFFAGDKLVSTVELRNKKETK